MSFIILILLYTERLKKLYNKKKFGFFKKKIELILKAFISRYNENIAPTLRVPQNHKTL